MEKNGKTYKKITLFIALALLFSSIPLVKTAEINANKDPIPIPNPKFYFWMVRFSDEEKLISTPDMGSSFFIEEFDPDKPSPTRVKIDANFYYYGDISDGIRVGYCLKPVVGFYTDHAEMVTDDRGNVELQLGELTSINSDCSVYGDGFNGDTEDYLLGVVKDVPSGGTASITWNWGPHDYLWRQEYQLYAVATDCKHGTTRSDTWPIRTWEYRDTYGNGVSSEHNTVNDEIQSLETNLQSKPQSVINGARPKISGTGPWEIKNKQNNSGIYSFSVDLYADVYDADGDDMDVYFYQVANRDKNAYLSKYNTENVHYVNLKRPQTEFGDDTSDKPGYYMYRLVLIDPNNQDEYPEDDISKYHYKIVFGYRTDEIPNDDDDDDDGDDDSIKPSLKNFQINNNLFALVVKRFLSLNIFHRLLSSIL